MPDPDLEARMHGEFAKKKVIETTTKDKFDLAIEKEIDKYINSLDLERESKDTPLASPSMRRAQIKEQMTADLQMPELENHVSSAISTLLSKGAHYLSPELYQRMESELVGIQNHFDSLELENSSLNKKFQDLLEISDPVMEGCFQIAIEKYREREFPESLSLFSFLTILNPGNVEYLYRLGITAQKNENYKFALRAFEATLELNPELLGALLFASECHFQLNDREMAVQYLKKAKDIAVTQPLDDVWAKLITDLEKLSK